MSDQEILPKFTGLALIAVALVLAASLKRIVTALSETARSELRQFGMGWCSPVHKVFYTVWFSLLIIGLIALGLQALGVLPHTEVPKR